MEQACSNIAMQRIVDDHTKYMVRARPKYKMDRAVTTYRLPLNRGAPSHSKVPVYPSTTPVYKETTRIPLGLRPYGSTSIGHGQT